MEASSPTVTEAAAESSVRTRPLSLVWRAIRPDLPFHGLVVGFIASAVLLHRASGYPGPVDLRLSWELLTLRSLIYAVPALVGALGWALIRRGRSLRSAETWRDTLAGFFSPTKTLAFALVCLSLPPFMSAFTAYKSSIPDIHPFGFDRTFMEWDRLLHFGEHPWVLLQSVLGSPTVTALIDWSYSLWFAVVWITVIWQVWHGGYFSDAREQFLLSFAACWIVLGVGFATLLSSAGPVYYGEIIGGPDPFAGLLTYLHEVDATRPLKALWIHDALWEGYVDPANSAFGEGISAMPSLHVSMVVLMALVGFRVNPWVGWAYAVFGIVIMIGSVHLAWHYAIDGYIAAGLTLVVWWGCGKVTDAWKGQEPRAGQAKSVGRLE